MGKRIHYTNYNQASRNKQEHIPIQSLSTSFDANELIFDACLEMLLCFDEPTCNKLPLSMSSMTANNTRL